VATQSIARRISKISVQEYAKPFAPESGSFSEFVNSLPRTLKAEQLKEFVSLVSQARRDDYPVIAMLGAHVVKVGLAPVIIDLLERKLVTAVAMNSATAIHDTEAALFGVTSEDVAENLKDGSFGMWRETGEFINGVLTQAFGSEEYGYGESLGRALRQKNPENLDISILASAVRLGVPVTVHAAIGTDIVHQQPTMDGAATGELSFRDFKVLAHSVKDLRDGGAVLNIGSAVILPEVFLKTLTVVRNLGYPANNFVTANFDMLQHYRPSMNVVDRPTRHGGKGYSFTGHHELMIPLFAAMLKQEYTSNG